MCNREVAKLVWKKIDFHGGFYASNFDEWYKDCWAECMEEAVDNILNGGCKFESGSYIEISLSISVDRQSHNVDVDKENFIEFYGEECCFRLFTLVDDIKGQLVDYAAGTPVSEHFSDDELEFFAEFNRQFLSLPCDDDGFSAEQESAADELIDEYAQKIFDKINS